MTASAGLSPPILVSGMFAGVPGHGGATWAVLQYIHGLRALGFDPVLIEPFDRPGPGPDALAYFHRVCETEGLVGRAAMLGDDGTAIGMKRSEVREAAQRAPALINLAGTLRDSEIFETVAVRLYVDLDPAFTQLWQSVEDIDMGLGDHTHFATVGLDVGSPGCDVPTLGVPWIPTLPPVALDRWPTGGRPRSDAWTTVANWRGYGSVEHEGRHYGQKAHAFRRLMSLPTRTAGPFEVALSIHPEESRDLEALASNGWKLIDPTRVASTPDRYRGFVTGSYAEIGVAKTGYVEAGCGWFSDRSACYLAAGRPVVAQDTGLSRHLPTGTGLLAFESEDDAVAGVEAVRGDYRRHARAAREIADAHLDARRVLGRLLSRVGVA